MGLNFDNLVKVLKSKVNTDIDWKDVKECLLSLPPKEAKKHAKKIYDAFEMKDQIIPYSKERNKKEKEMFYKHIANNNDLVTHLFSKKDVEANNKAYRENRRVKFKVKVNQHAYREIYGVVLKEKE